MATLNVDRETFEKELIERIELGKDLFLSRPAKYKYENWDRYNIELLQKRFDPNENRYAHEYKMSIPISNAYPLLELLSYKINHLVGLLQRVELMEYTAPPSSEKTTSIPRTSDKIFIVHGHDDGIKHELARILERLGLEPIILHEQANGGLTIIEKFEKHADVGFAIILLTDDDHGSAKAEGELKSRARQNVIFELGYFVGKLGRNSVCVLKKGNIEIPSDFSGVVYIDVANGQWKLELGKELKVAKYDIDLNKL